MNSKLSQKLTKSFFIISGFFTIAVLALIVAFILINGFPAINPEFIFAGPIDSGRSGGILPMIVSSLSLISIATLISVPIGVGSAIYVSEYCVNDGLVGFFRFISRILSSVPSIVFGLFGLAFLVFFLKMGWSIFSGAIVLALMAFPTIFQVSEVTLQSVPQMYREGCYAMGATKWQSIITVILPVAIPGIFTGIILAITRAFSEAAAVMYVVGSSLEMPISIFDTGRPLPLHLYILASEGISMENAYGTAAVLLIVVLVLTLFSNFAVSYYQKKIMGC